MEFTTENAHPKCATRADPATALRDSDRVLHQVIVDLSTKSPSCDTAWLEPAGMASTETTPSFMECVIAAHTDTNVTEEMAGTVVESKFDITDYKSKLPSKSVVKLPSDMRDEIDRTLPDLDVVTKTDAEAIIENSLTKWSNTLNSQIVRAVEFKLEDAL